MQTWTHMLTRTQVKIPGLSKALQNMDEEQIIGACVRACCRMRVAVVDWLQSISIQTWSRPIRPVPSYLRPAERTRIDRGIFKLYDKMNRLQKQMKKLVE